jgi:hypothetical protein
MLSGIRSRLTYANVMASIAVFGMLGGASYAAVQVKKNSVGPSQIKKNAVGSSELAPKSVGSSELKKSAKGSSTVRTATATVPLTCTESGGPGFFTLGCTGAGTARAACNQGERATGGGYAEPPQFQSGNQNSGATITESRPDPTTGTPTGFAVKALGNGFNSGGSPGLAHPPDPQVTVYAVCTS